MKRRSFLKGAAAAGAASLLPLGLMGLSTACIRGSGSAEGWNFDEVIDRSGTWSIKYRRAEGDKLAMWIADMDFKTDPVVHEALQQRLDRDVLGYTFTPEAFYDAIAGWEKSRHSYDVPREWVGYAPGVIAGINQAYLCFTQPGDKIVVQTPVYDFFQMYAKRLGREVVENPLIWRDGRYEMDFDGLERLYDKKVKVLVLCNPQNPIGILWPKETLARLADWAVAHDVLVFSDEIHADIALYGKPHFPFCSVSENAARIGLIFGSPTKAFNIPGITGTAWCIIPNPELRQRYQDMLGNAKLDDPSISTMVATIAAYTHEPVWLDAVKRYIEGNIEYLEESLQHNPDTRVIRPVRPEASYLVWLDCRALGLPQAELVRLFQEKARVVVNNGASYGTGGEGFVRLNIGCPRSIVEEAFHRLADGVC